MRFLAEYIMRGRRQAIMVVATLALLSMLMPPLSFLSSGGVALVTLRNGSKEGLIIVLIATLFSTVLALFLQANPQAVFGYGLLLWMPVWLVAMVLRTTLNIAVAIETAVFLGILFVLGFYAVVDDPVQFWHQMLTIFAESALTSTSEEVPVDQVKLTIERLAPFMTGMAAAFSVLGLLLGVMLGRWWQSQLFNPGGFGQEFTSMKPSPKFAMATVVIVAIALITDGSLSELVANISMPLVVLYTFIGTAIIHVLLVQTKHAKILLPLFYGLMFMFFIINPFIIMPIAFSGLADTWLNVRAKISNKTNS